MSTLKSPEFQEPEIPTREYWGDPEQTRKTKDKTRPGANNTVVDNVPVLEDWEHGLAVEQYKADWKIYNEQVLAWKENKAKCYYLVLLHCPRALEHQLKNSTKWDETESNQDVVPLLLVVGDVPNHLKESNHILLALRLVPLGGVLELMLERSWAVREHQVVTLGFIFLPGQHLFVVNLWIRLVLFNREAVLPIFENRDVVHDRVVGPRPCPVVGPLC